MIPYFLESIESGLVYEFADRYWVFYLRPLEHMDVFFEPPGKDSRRAVEGNTQCRSVSESSKAPTSRRLEIKLSSKATQSNQNSSLQSRYGALSLSGHFQ